MTNILLTGAGFTRNWGGWLVDEAFEYLLGCPEIDDALRAELWADKNKGEGYEATLARLQQAAPGDATSTLQGRVNTLTAALAGMFNLMDQGLRSAAFEKSGYVQFQVGTFLQKFDAIFTLNQDLLLERHYQKGVSLIGDRRFDSALSPSLHAPGTAPPYDDPDYQITRPRVPVEDLGFGVPPRSQPYFKLHGSMNWFDKAGGQLLVMGGNKTATINRSPLLKWYAEQFDHYLRRPSARLMIVGYGFKDDHINNAILAATANHGLKTFIIDPAGVDLLDRRPKQGIPGPPTPLMEIQPNIIGASRRRLLDTFGGDTVEHARVMKFFERF